MMNLAMNFDTDECLVTAMFDKGNRNDTMEAIDNIIPFLKGDADMIGLVCNTIRKLFCMSDEELLRQVGLAKMQNRKMKKLSGGMKRRAGIAQAMLNNPKILILDEPTAGLDPNERIRFRNLISELSQDRLVLLSTHIVSDIEYIANQVLLMKDGKISHSGTQEEIIQSVPVKVWSCVVANNEVEMWQKQFKVSNMKTLSDGIELRILSEKSPHYNAKEETMTLEDIFLYYFGEKTGDDYDVL